MGEYKANVILEGDLHAHKNNMGSKGVAVVSPSGEKEFEFEKEELILSTKVTSKINAMVATYNENKNSSTELELGKFVTDQILFNTEDRSKLYKTKVKKK